MRGKSRLINQARPRDALVSGHMDTLTQGISQQPEHIRIPGQGTQQINGWSSPVNGLCKRRGTTWADKIDDQQLTDLYVETIPITQQERYELLIGRTPAGGVQLQIYRKGVPSTIAVHGRGLTGTTATLRGLPGTNVTGDATSYLATAEKLRQSYVVINNGPLALLLNREQVTKMSGALSPAQPNEALIFVEGVSYEIKYVVKLDGVEVATYTTPKATDTNNKLSTDVVAEQLRAGVARTAGYTATREGSVVLVKKTDGSDFKIEVGDERGNTMARSFKGSATSFTGLPVTCFNGFVLKMEGSGSTTLDDYWVKFYTRDKGASGEGTWQETVAPGIPFQLDENTMPLVLHRKEKDVWFLGPADGTRQTLTVGTQTYEFTFPDWGDRTAGDKETVPEPSFVGKKIRDHVLFRSRYAVAAEESAVLSEVDQIFNFFGDTATQTLDTDPIDLRAVSETNDDLQWILPLDESMLLFSSASQYQLRPADADVLTPRTALLMRLSNIEANVLVRPKLAGPNVIFPTEENGFTGFREYQFYDTQARRIGLNLGGSMNLTLSVPRYVKGIVDLWDVGENLDYFCCVTPSDRKKVYVHKYLWQTSESSIQKAQASWSEWTFGGDIQWVRFYEGKLWLILTYPDGTFVETLEIEELQDTASPSVHLDRQMLHPQQAGITASYSTETKLTTWTVPYQLQGMTDVVVQYTGGEHDGMWLGAGSTGNQIVAAQHGDWSGKPVVIGSRYRFLYEFTRAYVPGQDQQRSRAVGRLTGRTQVATWTVNHTDTGQYKVRVSRKNRSIDSVSEFIARRVNVERNRLDQPLTPVLETGRFRVPVRCQNTECSVSVESDSYLPVTLIGASWEGTYSDRSRSLG